MAELGPEAHRTGDIANILNIKVGALGPCSDPKCVCGIAILDQTDTKENSLEKHTILI